LSNACYNTEEQQYAQSAVWINDLCVSACAVTTMSTQDVCSDREGLPTPYTHAARELKAKHSLRNHRGRSLSALFSMSDYDLLLPTEKPCSFLKSKMAI